MSESTMSEFVELAKAAEELKEATLPNSTQFHVRWAEGGSLR